MRNIRNLLKAILSLVAVTAVIVTPCIALDILSLTSNEVFISKSDWVSFMGGYIGAIIGAIATLVSVYLTIRHSEEEGRKDRKAQYAPYMRYEFRQFPRPTLRSELLDCIYYEDPEIGELNQYGTLTIINVGMGPALDYYITDVRCNGDLFPRPSVAIISNAITVNGKADLDIRLSGYCGEVPN